MTVTARTVLQDYGIQPNARREDESVVHFMERQTWFHAMTKALQKHSEFMRPDLNGFKDMEYAYPDIDVKPDTILENRDDGKYICNACHFTAHFWLGANDQADAQFCFPYGGQFCMTPEVTKLYEDYLKTGIVPAELGGGTEWPTLATFAMAFSAGTWNVQQTRGAPQSYCQVGDVGTKDQYGHTSNSSMAKVDKECTGCWICIGPCNGSWDFSDGPVEMEATFVDVYGNRCSAKDRVYEDCCDGDGYVAPTIDDSTDQVAPGGSLTLTLDGSGCSPYTWSVTGDGWSLDYSTTATATNTLRLADTACGTHDATCTVQVADKCPSSDSAKFRSTAGSWERIGGGGREGLCDLAQCCAPKTCAADGSLVAVYHESAGSGGAYKAYWAVVLIVSGCTGEWAPCCDNGNGNHSIGSGSDCGQDTILGSEYGCGSGACDCSWSLYYWTCGTDCS